MKIKHDSNVVNSEYNLVFQNYTEPIVERIFTTSGLGSINYINSFNSRPSNFSKSIIPTDELGDSEFHIIEKIKNSKIHTLVIRGGLGSGKTSTINFLTDHITDKLNCKECHEKSKCKMQKVFSINFDFSLVTINRTNAFTAIIGVYDGFYKLLIDYIYHYFGEKEYVVAFEDYLNSTSPTDVNKKNKRWIAGYSEIKNRINEDKDKVWASKTSLNKVEEIIKHIERNNKGVESRVESLFDLLIVIRNLYPGLYGCLFIVIDNIDGLPSETQVAVSSFFARLAMRTDIKFIIPVRHSTNSTIISGSGEITYSVYDHIPPNVCEIIQKRIEHLIDNKEKYDINSFPIEVKQAFINRAEHIVSLLKGSNNRLKDALKSLSGQSVRRGLSLSERLFLNHTFKYDEINTSEDAYINALLVEKNVSADIDYKDDLVSNIFCDYETQQNSLICLRILKTLLTFKEEIKKVPSIKTLINIIHRYYPYDDTFILKNLEYLSSQLKRLLYISSSNHQLINSSPSDLERLTVELTDAGKGYISNLLSDLTYVQRSFYSLDWSVNEFNKVKASIETAKLNHFINEISDSGIRSYLENIIKKGFDIQDIPTEVWESKPRDRFFVIRRMLSLMLVTDILQVIRYLYNNVGTYSLELYCKEIIINNSLAGVALSVLNILRNPFEPAKATIELEEWYSLILLGNHIEKSLLGSENRNLSVVIKKYNEVLKKR